MDVFFKICEELKITPVDFFDTENRYPEMMNRMIPYLKELTQEQLDTIEKIVKAIVENNKSYCNSNAVVLFYKYKRCYRDG